MPRQPGIYGPYRHGAKWRLHVIGSEGGLTCFSFDSKAEALEDKRKAEKRVEAQTGLRLDLAIDEYEEHMKRKNLKPRTIKSTRERLVMFFGEEISRPVATVSNALCVSRYRALTEKVATDTHRNALNQTRTFFKWCVAQRWIYSNPTADIEGQGKRKKGKPQLRYDEARKWQASAVELARAGEVGAVAALATLMLGMRASEIATRQVRDLDDGGRLLWIPDSKTESGKRTLEVPDVLRDLMLPLKADKLPEAPLFGAGRTRYWIAYWVQRICELAGVQRVCAHSMRGLHASMAVTAGATPQLVAAALGHASYAVTQQHYVSSAAEGNAKQKAALRVLEGGK